MRKESSRGVPIRDDEHIKLGPTRDVWPCGQGSKGGDVGSDSHVIGFCVSGEEKEGALSLGFCRAQNFSGSETLTSTADA